MRPGAILPSSLVCLGWGGVREGGVRPLGVVELHPAGNDPLGAEAVRDLSMATPLSR